MNTTRERILDTAEICFAQRGFDGASLREITRLAGVNLGAVNYHFGSKSALFDEVLRRRIEPMNRLRVELLDAAQSRHAPDLPPLEEILDAFIRPTVVAFSSSARATLLSFMHGMHEGQIDPDRIRNLFAEIRDRFSIIGEHIEPMPEMEFEGRLHFMLGGMIHLLADRIWPGSSLDPDTVVEMLVQWGAAVFRSPVTMPTERAR